MFIERKNIISVQVYYYKDYQFSSVFQIFLALASENAVLIVSSDLGLKLYM